MGGKVYVDQIVLGTIVLFTVTSDPNGLVIAPRGSIAFRVDAGNANITYRNTSASATGDTWTAT